MAAQVALRRQQSQDEDMKAQYGAGWLDRREGLGPRGFHGNFVLGSQQNVEKPFEHKVTDWKFKLAFFFFFAFFFFCDGFKICGNPNICPVFNEKF